MTTAHAQALDAFEARAQEDGLMKDGFFVQDEYEFELDLIPARNRAQLQAHLDKAPTPDHDSALFLKSFLMGDRTHFTSFDDE